MSTKNQHITEYLEYYLALGNPPEYAVLLRGDWGTGKSWFMKNFMANHPDQKFLHVSLYGITSYKEIEDAFYEQLHPILSSKIMKIGRKILTGVLKTTVKIDLDGTHKGDDLTATATLPDMVSSFDKSAEDRALIFDDLERCSIKTPDIMGYINQYVENYGLKVILLANEQELNKKTEEEKTDMNGYLRIKEKLIGKSFDIHADLDAALGVFIGQTRSEAMQKLLVKHKVLLMQAYNTGGYKNLRHLRQSVMDFDRFYDFLPADLSLKNGLLENLINLFFALSIEIRKGALTPDAIPRIFLLDYQMRQEGKEPTDEQKINRKYPVFGLYQQPLEPLFFVEFFKYGTLDPVAVNTCIKNSGYYSEENKKPWFKLLEFETLEDVDFKVNADLVWSDLTGGKIDNKYVLMHVIGLFSYFSDQELIDYKRPEIFALAKVNIERLKTDGKLQLALHEKLETHHPFNFVIYNIEDVDVLDFLHYFRKTVEAEQVDGLPVRAAKLLQDLKDNYPRFIVQLILSNSPDNLYYATPILAQLSVDDFVNAYMSLPNASKYYFFDGLEKRYEFSQFITELQPEKDWWEKVVIKFTEQKATFTHKVTGKVLERATGKIGGFVAKLSIGTFA
jgi:hypothetical protein